jgi:chromosome segregation ATPase
VAAIETETQKAGKPAAEKPIVPEDDAIYGELSPENKVAYRQSKLALELAAAAYQEARRALEEDARKPERDFAKAKEAYEQARDRLSGKDGLLTAAEERLQDLAKLAGKLNPRDLILRDRPGEAREQIAKLQEALDAYKACTAAVAAQQQAVEDSKVALQKVSEPQGRGFEAEAAKPSETAKRLASEQRKLALAQAQIPLDAAFDAYERKLAELKGSGPRVLQ